jgi:hypothetical protein
MLIRVRVGGGEYNIVEVVYCVQLSHPGVAENNYTVSDHVTCGRTPPDQTSE